MNDKPKLVWSDDPKDREKIAADANDVQLPEMSDSAIDEKKWVAVFRLEKAQRGGKTVTVIDQLPRQDKFLRELCKELKAKCGSGGTYKLNDSHGTIEIQGDKREQIKTMFTKKGFRYKGM